MISALSSAVSGLTANTTKLAVSANNTANINTDGFKKSRVSLEDAQPQGVQATVEKMDSPGPVVLEQTEQGETMVEKSNVELTEEITSQMLAEYGFKANLKTIQTTDEMLGSLLDIKA